MKIATLANASVVHTQRWVEHFRARGHEVRVFSLERGPDSLAAVRLPAAPLPGALRYPLAVPALRRALAAFEPDLVDSHYVPNYGLMAALAGRRPFSIAAWGSDLLLAAGRDPLQRARAGFAMRRASLVLCDAENLAAAARRAGAPPGIVRAVPWGVDRERFRPDATREPGLIVSVRMHEPVYDLTTVIRALAPVLAAPGPAHAVFVGDGSLRAELERLARDTLPAQRYRFTGCIPPAEMAALLARAEVCVSASLGFHVAITARGDGRRCDPGGSDIIIAKSGWARRRRAETTCLRLRRTHTRCTALADPNEAARARVRERRGIARRGTST
jgi:glycosyltransferase involved in cell wall biosynthesis